jgi:hypothetical protein
VGRTRTGPADDCELTKIPFCSCAKYTAGFFNAYARIAERDDLDGEAQDAWGLEALAGSHGAWRLVANPVMIGQVFSELEADEIGEPLSELGVLTRATKAPIPTSGTGIQLSGTDSFARSVSGNLRTSFSSAATSIHLGRWRFAVTKSPQQDRRSPWSSSSRA